MTQLSHIADFLMQNDNFISVIHDNPDGDCLGSAIGLCIALKQIGKTACIVCPSEIPKRLKFLNSGGDTDIYIGLSGLETAKSNGNDCIISIDLASDSLLGSVHSELCGKIKLAIDHHMINTLTADKKFVDSSAAATGQIIYRLIKTLEEKTHKALLTKNCADALYTAVSSDSGCFKYSNVTPETHRIAAFLIEAGASHADINYRLFDVKTKMQIDVEKLAYEYLTMYENDKIALIYIPQDKLDEIGAKHEDTECLSQLARTIEGVQIGIYMYNKSQNEYKLSVRSNNNSDISSLCALFEGGGHKKAAGCTITDTSPMHAQSIFIDAAKDFLD